MGKVIPSITSLSFVPSYINDIQIQLLQYEQVSNYKDKIQFETIF